MIKAVFFDVDGTMLDTTEYIYQAFEHTLHKHLHDPMLRDEMRHMMGHTLEQCYQHFTGKQDVKTYMDMHKEYQVSHPDLLAIFPGVKDTLEELHKKYKIAAVTSRANRSAIHSLEYMGISKYLDFFVGFDDVKNHKPHPEGIVKALNYFAIMPQEAIMVGDSPQDIQAGKAAGVKTIAVTHGFHGKQIIDEKPEYIVDNFDEILNIFAL